MSRCWPTRHDAPPAIVVTPERHVRLEDARATAVCDVHWARLPALRPHHLRLLDGQERARWAAYVHDRDRDRFALAAVLLRVVVAARTGIAPGRLRIDRTCSSCGEPHDRPRIAGGPVEVSVSHSGDVAAIAVTDAGRVGIDVEEIRPLHYAPLADEVCAGAERASVRSLHDFYVTWVRKESVLKAVGVGLDIPMAHLVVAPPTEAPRLLSYRDPRPMPARMVDAAPGEGYAGAVTVLTARNVAFSEHASGEQVARSER